MRSWHYAIVCILAFVAWKAFFAFVASTPPVRPPAQQQAPKSGAYGPYDTPADPQPPARQ